MSPAMSNPEEKGHDKKEDRISKLANDILIYNILSRMEVKEATRTSILSTSWRYLSTYFTSLEFDVSEKMTVSPWRGNAFKYEEPRFVNWVNQVLNLHRASFINIFRVCFPLVKTRTDEIDKWVKFAISKKVKQLELDFLPYTLHCYTLHSYVLKCDYNDISFVRSLCFSGVNISGKVVELLLSKCHLLERLSVTESLDLLSLEVTNSSTRLKYLAIRACWKLRELTLDVESLVYFEFCYNKRDSNVAYKNVPSLTEACFGPDSCKTFIPDFRQITCFSAHLSKLSLDMDMIDEDYHTIPPFLNVKHLELIVNARGHRSLLALRCIPEACPLLHHLRLKVFWLCVCEEQSDSESEEEYDVEDVQHWLEAGPEDSSGSGTLPYLRKLEWVGAFGGHVGHADAELILALYILKNAITLEELICDSRDPYCSWNLPKVGAPRRRAEQLTKVIPSRIHGVLL